MSPIPIPIPNCNVLIQELTRVRDNALPEFWYFEDEIWSTYALASELITDLWAIDKLVEAIDFNQAIEIGSRFESLANRLFSIPPHFKQAFTTKDKAFSWRGATTNNIVQAIESEARVYIADFDLIVSEGCTENLLPEEAAILLVLRTQIRQRAAKDDNAENAGEASTSTPEAEKGEPRLIRWSNYRQPQEWMRLRKLKELAHSANTWPKLRRSNPNDIQCESTKIARISFELAETWGLDLPEFKS